MASKIRDHVHCFCVLQHIETPTAVVAPVFQREPTSFVLHKVQGADNGVGDAGIGGIDSSHLGGFDVVDCGEFATPTIN